MFGLLGGQYSRCDWATWWAGQQVCLGHLVGSPSTHSTLFSPPFYPLPPTLGKREKEIERKEKRFLTKVRGQKGGSAMLRLLPAD